jgi:hypothetical protein
VKSHIRVGPGDNTVYVGEKLMTSIFEGVLH